MKFLSRQQGFSLLELLVALIILSIGLLAFAQAEIAALRDNQTTYFRSIANLQAVAMAEHLRACAHQLHCVSKTKAAWQKENNLLLPNESSLLHVNGASHVIKITWMTAIKKQEVILKTPL